MMNKNQDCRAERVKKTQFLSELDRKLLNKESSLQFIGRDMLKYIALFFMTTGHWAMDIYKNLFHSRPFFKFFAAAQYFAPPVFFFFIAEGFHYTRSKRKYAIRLLIFAVITQIPHSLTFPEGLTLYNLFLRWNVIMTLFLGLCALIVLHCEWELPLRLIVIVTLMGISWLLNCEWAVSGILIMLLFDLLRGKPLIRLGGYIVLMFAVICVTIGQLPDKAAFLRYLLPVWSAGIVITFLYNGRKGRFPVFSKCFFYIWYPLHLLLLWLFRIIQG